MTREEHTERMRQHVKQYRPTLCWFCRKATGGCSWSHHFEPIEGWDAEPTLVGTQKSAGGMQRSYHVKHCPEFEVD